MILVAGSQDMPLGFNLLFSVMARIACTKAEGDTTVVVVRMSRVKVCIHEFTKRCSIYSSLLTVRIC